MATIYEPGEIVIKMGLNLEKAISESREVAQALNEFADALERIEKRYADLQESEETDADSN